MNLPVRFDLWLLPIASTIPQPPAMLSSKSAAAVLRTNLARSSKVSGLAGPSTTPSVSRALSSTATSSSPSSTARRLARPSSSSRLPSSPLPALSPPLRSYSSASSSPQTVQDTSHPTGLYFHSIPSPSSDLQPWAVSPFSSPPASPDHPSVMAWVYIPASASSQRPVEYARNHTEAVVANEEFWRVLHETLKEDVVRGSLDEVLIQEADLREAGWAHLAGG